MKSTATLTVIACFLGALGLAQDPVDPVPTLGFLMEGLSEEPGGDEAAAGSGVVVTHVFRGSPACRAGIRPGNRLRRLDGAPFPAPGLHLPGPAPGLRSHLAFLYEQGRGVERDSLTARELNERACRGGYPPACAESQ